MSDVKRAGEKVRKIQERNPQTGEVVATYWRGEKTITVVDDFKLTIYTQGESAEAALENLYRRLASDETFRIPKDPEELQTELGFSAEDGGEEKSPLKKRNKKG